MSDLRGLRAIRRNAQTDAFRICRSITATSGANSRTSATASSSAASDDPPPSALLPAQAIAEDLMVVRDHDTERLE
jgi:hypothetical protein